MIVSTMNFECTHKEAVKRIALWMRNRQSCAVVMAERHISGLHEQPDVIGWGSRGESILVECKVSRSDFHADKQKTFRQVEDRGVGSLRYFAAPRGVLTAEDMPEGWGLLEITEYQIRVRKTPERKTPNQQAEVAMLVSAIRRLELSATVFVRHEPLTEDVQVEEGIEVG